MEILVCFAMIADPKRASLGLDDDDGDPIPVMRVVDPHDEAGLDLAAGLRGEAERAGRPIAVSALTIGGPAADPLLRTLTALRFDRAIRIATPTDLLFRPDVVAALIAAKVRELAIDVVILGRQAGEADDGRTPLLLAEALGWPCLGDVVAIGGDGGDRLRVTSRTPAGTVVRSLAPPGVLIVGDAATPALRSPTLKDRMSVGRRPIGVVEGVAIPDDPGDAAPVATEPIRRERAGRMLAREEAISLARVIHRTCGRTRSRAP